VETQDKDVILEGLSTVSSHDEWTPLSISGHHPKPRYEVRQISPFPIRSFNTSIFLFFYSTNKNLCNCSMERLCCKIRCIYLVGTIMGVTLVTFRYAQLNKTTHKAISMHSKLSAMAFKHVSHVAYAVLLLLIKSALNRASHLIHSLQSLSISLHGCSRKKILFMVSKLHLCESL